jgi:glutamate dehydrogenase (NADP+)
MYDSNGYIYDKNGIQLDVIKDIKEVKRGRIKEYAERVKGAEYHEGCKGIWTIPCDIALPCATQNEIDAESAKILVKNGVKFVGEGANMPSTLEAISVFQNAGVVFLPAKAANAGGVATSALEMAQSSGRMFWSFEEVDAKLKNIMVNIYHNIDKAAKDYGFEGNYVMGANIAGFVKVADAMMAHGIV